MKKAKSSFPKAIDSQRSRLKAEAKRFDVKHFRPGQLEIMEAVLAGKSVLGIMPTGSGKSLTFQLPALLLPKATIVVSPLISLMQDQVAKAEQANVEAAKLNSTLTASEDRETRDAVAEGEHRLIYVTPERLENPEYLALLRSGGVSLFVIDEAHCISQWGHDFRPSYLSLRQAVQKLGNPPVLALTATATPDVQQDINRQLGLQDPVVIRTGIERPNLFLEVFRTVNSIAKRERIRLIVDETEGTGIVYVATVRTANELYEWLCNSGVNAARYHGKMKTRERESTQQDFMAGAFKLIVATKAFGLGIDKPDIRFIIHYNFPDSLESYYQEIGRAGRDGQAARCPLLYRLEDRRIQGFFLGGKYPKREQSQQVYKIVSGSEGSQSSGITVQALFEASGLPRRKVQVILSQLESAGILERRAGKIKCIRTFATPEEMTGFLGAYEQRHMGDRQRIETMMRYAETTFCRVRFLREYFGAESGEDCEHCDNCRARAQGVLPVSKAASRAAGNRQPNATVQAFKRKLVSGKDNLFHIGDRVRHKRFGTGQITEIAGQNLDVDFGQAGHRRIRRDYVRKAS